MRKKLLMLLLLFLCLLILPVFALDKPHITENVVKTSNSKIKVVKQKKKDVFFSYDEFNLKLKSGEIKKISAYDYVLGSVAAEMPGNYEKEALKAQAVACYTYACRKKYYSSENYDITDNSKIDQSYLSYKELKEKWGDKYKENKEKIGECVKSVLGQVLIYENKPCLALYHAVSSGVTNSAKDVFGSDVKYLIPKDSSFDKNCEFYKKETFYPKQEIKDILKKEYKDIDFDTEAVSKINKSDSGLVTDITLYGKNIEGYKLKTLLNLRSQTFDITVNENGFTFTTYGYGHGVGMSQYGAQCLAKSGSTYKEILMHYYADCSLG